MKAEMKRWYLSNQSELSDYIRQKIRETIFADLEANYGEYLVDLDDKIDASITWHDNHGVIYVPNMGDAEGQEFKFTITIT